MGHANRLSQGLAALVLVLSCGPAQEPPDYQSRSGVSYRWISSSFAPDLIEEQETWFLAKLQDLGEFDPGITASALHRAEAQIYGEKLVCQSSTGYCNGDQDGVMLRVRNMGCPFDSALTHELAHLIQEAHGIYDYQHQDLGLWAIADGAPRPCP